MKVAIVHDWLTGMRGGEKVLAAILELHPDSDLFTLIHNPGSVSELIESRNIYTSFIDRLPFKAKHYRNYLPLFPTAIELFDFKGYDLVISTSHCVAKGIRTPPDTLHISYVHSPMRYVWDMYEDYFSSDKLNFVSRKLIPLFANYLRMWDVTSSNRVDQFIANSGHVAKRIQKYYNRQATVIHPPVDTDLFRLSENSSEYYLIISALVPYKKVDLAVQAFNQSGKRLVVIGDGPEFKKLAGMAGRNVQLLNWLPPKDLTKYYAECKALIFPGEEDFGIVPVEAQACGKPVIAFARGGALETVIGFSSNNADSASGVFFHEQTAQALNKAIEQADTVNWNSGFIHNHALKFSKENFKINFKNLIDQQVEHFFSNQPY